MNIKDFEYVSAVVEQGSISKAAERLCITQGALTKYLKRLERELDMPIFYRLGNQFLLTKAGEIYLKKAQQIIQLNRELEEELSLLASSREAAVRMGCPMGMQSFVMDTLLPEFFRQYPQACVSLEEGSSLNLVRKIEEAHLDICLAYVSERRIGLQYEFLSRTRMVLAVPLNSPLIKQAKIQQGQPYPVLTNWDWLNEPYISIAPHTQSGRDAERYFRRIGRRPHTRLYVDDTRNALAAVESQIGNCLLAAIPNTDRRVRYLYLDDSLMEHRDIFLVYRKEDVSTKSLKDLFEVIRQLYIEDDKI